MFSFFKSVPSISTKELESLLSEKIQIIDVRTPAEYRARRIKSAKNVPLNYIDSFQEEGKVYVICQSGMRSKRAAKLLMKKGYDVVNVRGGMSAYAGKTVTGK